MHFSSLRTIIWHILAHLKSQLFWSSHPFPECHTKRSKKYVISNTHISQTEFNRKLKIGPKLYIGYKIMWFEGFLRSPAFTHTSDPICLEKCHFSDKPASIGWMAQNLEKYILWKKSSLLYPWNYTNTPKLFWATQGYPQGYKNKSNFSGKLAFFTFEEMFFHM